MKIDKGVPVERRKLPVTELSVLIAKMVPGDSVLCADDKECHRAAAVANRTYGFKTLTRKTREGWRMWRLEGESKWAKK